MAIDLSPKFFGFSPTLGMQTLAGQRQISPELVDLASPLGDVPKPTATLYNGAEVSKNTNYNYGTPGIGNNFKGGVGLYDYSRLPGIKQGIVDQKTNSALAELANPGTVIDDLSRAELSQMFAQHTSDPDTLLATLAQAKAGVGMFAARRVNEAQRKFLASHPGRAQLISGLNRF